MERARSAAEGPAAKAGRANNKAGRKRNTLLLVYNRWLSYRLG
jgi:hypothetical protein